MGSPRIFTSAVTSAFDGPRSSRGDFKEPQALRRCLVLPFGRLWYDTPDDAVGYAIHDSRSHNAVIRVYDLAGNVIETHEHASDFREW
jgi:hypothetical protein